MQHHFYLLFNSCSVCNKSYYLCHILRTTTYVFYFIYLLLLLTYYIPVKKSAELVFHIPTVFLILKSFCVIFAHHRFDLLSSLLYCFFSLCYDQNKYRVATFLLVFYYIYAHKYYLFRLLILN